MNDDWVRPCGDGWQDARSVAQRVHDYMIEAMSVIEPTVEQAEWLRRVLDEAEAVLPKMVVHAVPIRII